MAHTSLDDRTNKDAVRQEADRLSYTSCLGSRLAVGDTTLQSFCV